MNATLMLAQINIDFETSVPFIIETFLLATRYYSTGALTFETSFPWHSNVTEKDPYLISSVYAALWTTTKMKILTQCQIRFTMVIASA